MPTTRLAILFAALISLNLAACSSMSGNVVPPSGPPMESVYDKMGTEKQNKAPLKEFRETHKNKENYQQNNSAVHYHRGQFHKIPNPELNLYIAPHLAGQEQMPVPGYTTVFNGYEQTHYAL